MRKAKKTAKSYNIWTVPAEEWHSSLKKLKVPAQKKKAVAGKKVSTYTGERRAEALNFSAAQGTIIGSFKRSLVR